MRVLTVGNMYPPHHLGGYELMWQSWVAQMRASAHEVRVLTSDYRDGGVARPDDPDVHRDLRWYWQDHDFPRKSLHERLRLERHNGALLDRHLEDFDPDAVCWWAMGGMSMSLLERVRRRGLPAVSVVVDDWLVYGPMVDQWIRLVDRPLIGPVAARLTGVPARVEYEAAARWIFASKALRRAAVSRGYALDDADVVYPGIDTGLFSGPSGPPGAWGWRLLYVGRVEPRKGVDIAIEALELLPEARLTVLGPGEEDHMSELRRLAERLGVADRVEFGRRPREELPAAYEEADVTLFPVRWAEPFGLVPLESMAMGTPVIASGRGGSGEYLGDGDNCLLFEVDRGAPALAPALERLAADPELRERLHSGGLATARRFPTEAFDRRVAEAVVGSAR